MAGAGRALAGAGRAAAGEKERAAENASNKNHHVVARVTRQMRVRRDASRV